MAETRMMTDADVRAIGGVWDEAFDEMRARFGMPPDVHTPESAARLERRIRHLLSRDPEGSWVAVDAGRLLGGVQALRREGLWVLSHLGVATHSQGTGVGRALLERAIAYGSGADPGLILSSRDPRAMRQYTLAGFKLRPAVTARGPVVREGLEVGSGIRDGTADDLATAEEVDRRIRGAAHGPDLEHMLAGGAAMLVVPGSGYVVHARGQPLVLAATDTRVARALLMASLAHVAEGATVEINWLTAEQQWAVDAALRVRLVVEPLGPLMVRGTPGPLAPYLPSGPFG